MDILKTRPGFGPIHSLPGAVARRWPALAVATIAVAIPTGVALAEQFGNTTIVGSLSNAPALLVQAATAGGAGVEVSNADGAGINVSASQDGIVVDAGNPSAGSFAAIRATSLNEGLVATGGNPGFVGRAVGGQGTAVTAVAEHTGMDAFGHDAGVTAEGDKTGVVATGQDGVIANGGTHGVIARADSTAGSFAGGVLAQGDEGVVARGNTIGVDSSASGTAVAAQSNNGLGGFFGGKEAPIRLAPAATPGAPTTGAHHRGDLYVDSNGALFFCTADGTPGTWKQVVLK